MFNRAHTMKTFRLLIYISILLSSYASFCQAVTPIDTLPKRPSKSTRPGSRLAPAPMTLPGTRLDTHYRTLPAQGADVAKAAPAWLKAKAKGTVAFYIVDGKAATATQLKKLKQKEVASVHFLEGDKAASLYGKNARNGMVIVTTKAGDTTTD